MKCIYCNKQDCSVPFTNTLLYFKSCYNCKNIVCINCYRFCKGCYECICIKCKQESYNIEQTHICNKINFLCNDISQINISN